MIKHHREVFAGDRRPAMRASSRRPKSWPLQIYMLGRFDIRVEGVSLPKRRKTPHRLRELLQAIVASGGAAVPVAYLIDQLWPNSDGDRAVATFAKTLKRLRKYLAVDRVVHLDHGTVTLDPTRCWVDVRAFEEDVASSEEILFHARVRGWTGELQQALALYRGPFILESMVESLGGCDTGTAPRTFRQGCGATQRPLAEAGPVGAGDPMVESGPPGGPACCAAIGAAYHAALVDGAENRSLRRLSLMCSSIREGIGTHHPAGRPVSVQECPQLRICTTIAGIYANLSPDLYLSACYR